MIESTGWSEPLQPPRSETDSFHNLLLCMLGAASFACGGGAEPSVTLNQQLAFTQDGVRDPIMGSCTTLQRGQAWPGSTAADRGAMPFQQVASRAPDLEIAQTFNGQRLRVIARTPGASGLPPEVEERTYAFDFLMSGGRAGFLVNRAAGGAYELQYWGGDCQSSGSGTN